jgi:hypothetical protein
MSSSDEVLRNYNDDRHLKISNDIAPAAMLQDNQLNCWRNLRHDISLYGPPEYFHLAYQSNGLCWQNSQTGNDIPFVQTPLPPGVVSIKPRHLRLNCGKPRLYVSIAKNRDFSGNYSQCAQIRDWSRIDRETDRWDPPVSADVAKNKVICWVGQGPHTSV